MASPRDRVSNGRPSLGPRVRAALLALTFAAPALTAQASDDWETLPLDQALERVEAAPDGDLVELEALATELLELNPERWHTLRSRAAYRLLVTPTGEIRPFEDVEAACRLAKHGGVSLAWLVRNGRPWTTAPTNELINLAVILYTSGLGPDPEVRTVFRASFELAEPEDVAVATQILVEYLQVNGFDDDCQEILEDAKARTAELRAAGVMEVLVIDLMEARLAMQKGRTTEALRIGIGVMAELMALDEGRQIQEARMIVAAQESIADFLLDLGRNDDVIAGNEALLEREELFSDQGLDENLLLQIAMALVQSGDLDAGERERATTILSAQAAGAANPYRRHLSLSLLGLLALEREAPDEAIELARRAEALELDLEIPALDRALRLAVGLRGHRRGGELEDEVALRWRAELGRRVEGVRAQWRAEEHDVGGEANWLDFRARLAIAELLVQLAEQDRVGEAVSTLSGIQSTSRLARSLGASDVTLDTVRRHLTADDRGVVLFFFGWGTTIAIAIGADEVVFEQTPQSSRLIDRSIPFASALRQSPNRSTPRRAKVLATEGRALGEALFPEPVRELVATWEEALIIGGDALAGGTVGALPVLSDRPLSHDLAIAHFPSLAGAVELAKRADRLDSSNRRSVVALEAVHDEEIASVSRRLAPIRLKSKELEALIDPLPEPVVVLRREEATWSKATEAGSRAVLLELFTHGFRYSGEPIPASFLLSPDEGGDGTVRWADVAGTKLPPWVVLATCASGSGEPRIGGEGSSDLRGTFLEAGALGVVHAYGNVDQVATHALLVELHRALAEGMSLSRALRRARTKLWEREDFRDPYFTTLIQVFGLGDRAVFRKED